MDKPLPPAAIAAAQKKKAEAELSSEEKKALKEQRRLKQEADRLAKNKSTVNAPSVKRAQASGEAGESIKPSTTPTSRPLPEKQQQLKTSGVAQKKQVASLRAEAQKKVPLFLHLKQYERASGSLSRKVGFSENAWVHPSVLTLGLRYSEFIIRGADARMVAMFQAFVDVIRDFTTPPNSNEYFQRALTKQLNLLFDFLTRCRPHSISMGNAFNYLKAAINSSAKSAASASSSSPPPTTTNHSAVDGEERAAAVEEEERIAKRFIFAQMEAYVRDNIFAAGEEIAIAGSKLIVDGDVILVFAWSSVVERTLLYSHKTGKRFTVLVVGARPHQEGLELLQRLVKHGLTCRYGNLQAISYMLQGVDKVFLGASALLSNGAILSRAGTAMVAMMAKAQRKPVYVFAGAHKFSERVLLDSIVYNELGDPEDLLVDNNTMRTSRHVLADWRDSPTLKLLNLQYDVTSSEFVDMVVTEVGNLPPTSVSVILRERNDKATAAMHQ
ncbi:hypothetical protein BASA81_002478 [Batrachochytrium salamandrivorans]|nr:hypothetical protein BASA81_002478 [Batrachochytrium salamandrivorans]